MKLFRILLLVPAFFSLQAAVAQKEDKAIKAVVNRFFEGMQKGDTVLLKSACTEAPVFQTFMTDKDGNLSVLTEDFGEFVKFIGSPTPNKFEERIVFAAIHTEQALASVWAPYRFYLNGKLSHCGTDSFQLVKTTAGWKIQYIIDTRRKDCRQTGP